MTLSATTFFTQTSRHLHITQDPKLTIPTSDSTYNFIMNGINLVITPCPQFLKQDFSLDYERNHRPGKVECGHSLPQYISLFQWQLCGYVCSRNSKRIFCTIPVNTKCLDNRFLVQSSATQKLCRFQAWVQQLPENSIPISLPSCLQFPTD